MQDFNVSKNSKNSKIASKLFSCAEGHISNLLSQAGNGIIQDVVEKFIQLAHNLLQNDCGDFAEYTRLGVRFHQVLDSLRSVSNESMLEKKRLLKI